MKLEELFDLLFESSLMYPKTTITIMIRSEIYNNVSVAFGHYFQSQIQRYIRRNVEEFSINFNSDHLEVVVDGDLVI